MKRIALITVILAFVAVPAVADLADNGSFELGTHSGGAFDELDAGSTAITDWTIIGGGVRAIDYIGGYWVASEGSRSLDLNGRPGPGGVEQIISTTINSTYVVTFDMAGNPAGGPTIKTMDVSAIGVGTQLQSYEFDITGKSTSNMGWATQQFTFVADSDNTTLRFMSTVDYAGQPGYPDSVGWGPALDNVSVVPVPGAVLLGMLGLSLVGVKLRKHA